MAQPFSPKQRDAIRERLKESARKYAVSTGVKKTSLDMLTADAGISKSSFYKFFGSKELLFLEIANDWEMAGHRRGERIAENQRRHGRQAPRREHGLHRVHDDSRARHLQLSVRRPARSWRASFPKRKRARTTFPPRRAFSTCSTTPKSTSPSRTRLCWPRFRFCICPSSTSTESARTSSPRCGCWSWAHARSWWRNGQTAFLSRRLDTRPSADAGAAPNPHAPLQRSAFPAFWCHRQGEKP